MSPATATKLRRGPQSRESAVYPRRHDGALDEHLGRLLGCCARQAMRRRQDAVKVNDRMPVAARAANDLGALHRHFAHSDSLRRNGPALPLTGELICQVNRDLLRESGEIAGYLANAEALPGLLRQTDRALHELSELRAAIVARMESAS